MTHVGEHGIVLSGGQRARVELARAVYSDADIYLLDDPLSAMDSKVGQHLFHNCIDTLLNGKTRLMITHNLQGLNEAKNIVFMNNAVKRQWRVVFLRCFKLAVISKQRVSH